MDSLTTREWSLLIWMFGITGYLLLSPKFVEVQESFRELIKNLLARQIITIMILITVYVITCVYGLFQAGLWGWHQLKVTIIWYVLTATLVIFKLQSIKKDYHYFKNLVLNNFKLVAILGFVVGTYTFNLYIELILMPLLFLISGMLGIAQSKKEYKSLEKILNGILALIGFLFVTYSIYMVFFDFGKIANQDSIRDFYVPPLLTLTYLPFIFIMMLYITYENEFLKLQFFINNRWLRIYAKACALFLFNVRIVLLGRWIASLAFYKPHTISEVHKSIRQIFKMVSIESSPPKINNSEGWSPYTAKDFLADLGIKTGYYQFVGGNEWYSNSEMIELDEAIFPNNISFYIIGNEHVAILLKLILNVNSPESIIIAKNKLLSSAKLLFIRATNLPFPNEIEEVIEKGINYSFEVENYSVVIEKHDWPTHIYGGYDINFSISCRQED